MNNERMQLINMFDFTYKSEFSEYIKNADTGIKQFITTFPIDSLKNLPIEKYVISKKAEGKTDTFCYMLQYSCYNSSMKGCHNDFYGIFSSDGYHYKLSRQLQSKNFSCIEDAYQWQLTEIIKLLEAGRIHDLDAIEHNEVNNYVKCKLLSVYYPDQYLPINARDYTMEIMEFLDIPYDKNEHIIRMLERLYQWKNKQNIVKDWSNFVFMHFCNKYYKGINQFDWVQKAKEICSELKYENLSGKNREAVVKVRVNQGIFRYRLLQKYHNCVLCRVSKPEFLVASHIKPWCESLPEEMLDIENGFLMCPNHDKLFDGGWITFENDGKIVISSQIKNSDCEFMNINKNMKLLLSDKNREYLKFHRERIFKR